MPTVCTYYLGFFECDGHNPHFSSSELTSSTEIACRYIQTETEHTTLKIFKNKLIYIHICLIKHV